MKIIFFDGYCSICNSLVDWLMRIDKSGELKFASLQGEAASQLLEQSKNQDEVDTIVYLRNNQKFERSTAVLRILLDLGGVWSLARIFLILPQGVRDFIYTIVARNRYRFAKKRETCRMPTSNEQQRLLK